MAALLSYLYLYVQDDGTSSLAMVRSETEVATSAKMERSEGGTRDGETVVKRQADLLEAAAGL
jgi:hypothetical protein